MDILQVILVISLVLLTTLLVFLGIQVYYILQEVKKTLQILQKTLDNTAEITEMAKNPIFALTQIKGWGSVVGGLREGIRLYKSFRQKQE
ncbi:MAG: hypothetical protein M3Q44_02205 [bacterium]|nr:hypothetical protein [bacterium]